MYGIFEAIHHVTSTHYLRMTFFFFLAVGGEHRGQRKISLASGEHLSFHASTGGKQQSSGILTATMVAMWLLTPHTAQTFGKAL